MISGAFFACNDDIAESSKPSALCGTYICGVYRGILDDTYLLLNADGSGKQNGLSITWEYKDDGPVKFLIVENNGYKAYYEVSFLEGDEYLVLQGKNGQKEKKFEKCSYLVKIKEEERIKLVKSDLKKARLPYEKGVGCFTQGVAEFEAICDRGEGIEAWELDGLELEGEKGHSLKRSFFSETKNIFELHLIYNTPIVFGEKISATVDDESIESESIKREDTKIKFAATPSENKFVKCWKVNDTAKDEVMTDFSYTVLASDIGSKVYGKIVISFEEKDTTTLQFGSDIAKAEKEATPKNEEIKTDYKAKCGDKIIFTVPKGKKAKEWKVNDKAQAATDQTGETFTYDVGTHRDGKIVVSCELLDKEFTLTFESDIKEAKKGSAAIKSDDKVKYGDKITFTANVPKGKKVKAWKVNGKAQTGQTGVTFTYDVPDGKEDDPITVSCELEDA